MITRIAGILESVETLEATVRPGGGLTYQVMLPSYLAQRLRDRVGQAVELHTIQYFEGQLGGSTLVPRLVGFQTTQERRFFELLTSVDGLGNRKALRALAEEPASIARAVGSADVAWLTRLPEIGKKTAEKVILELKSKITPFLSPDEVSGLNSASAGPVAPTGGMGAAALDAVEALVTLGETRPEAERRVRLALAKGAQGSADEILARVFGG